MSRQPATISGRALLVWALLLLAPGFAIWRLLPTLAAQIASGWIVLISIVTFTLYAMDKRQAQQGGQRESESHLHLLELLGGWPGAFLGQHLLRHKSSKVSYQFIFWLIVLLHQVVAYDALSDGWILGQLRNLAG